MVWNRIEVHIGPGGGGKTHNQLTDKGLVGVGYFAPTWKLFRKKSNEYGVIGDVWKGLNSKNPKRVKKIQNNYNVLIIDEISMMSDALKKQIISTYPDHKLIFCGDLGYQLPPWAAEGAVEDEEIEEFKIEDGWFVQEHNILYRCLCPKLQKRLFYLREIIKKDEYHMDLSRNFDWIKILRLEGNVKDLEWVKENYNYKKDLIICPTNRACDFYTNLFKHHKKYKITHNDKNDHKYSNGDIKIDSEIEGIPEKKYEKRHGYTIHAIQGETCENILFIEMCGMRDARMLYTAMSRARYLEKIIFINTKWIDLDNKV
tara:strand:+ start:763 stop:1707 length:945 start_codon:yes stop_codon:yes gene_type:complete